MKKIRNWVFGGIQQKVFNLMLFTMIFMIGAYSVIIIQQSEVLTRLSRENNAQQQAAISQITDETMDSVVVNTLGKSTVLKTTVADNIFADIRMDVELMRQYAADLYADPHSYKACTVSPPDPEKTGVVEAQYLGEEGVDLGDPANLRELGLLGNMTSMMKGLVLHEDHLGACYIGTENGTLVIVDAVPETKIDDNGRPIRVNVRGRYWYKAALEAGELTFTKVETDMFTGKTNITCACPVYVDGELKAVVGADLFLDELQEAIEESMTDSGFEVILNKDGQVIFSPQTSGLLQVYPTDEAPDLRMSADQDLGRLIRTVMDGTTDVLKLKADGREYYATGSSIGTLGWTLVSFVDKEATDIPRQMILDSYEQIAGKTAENYHKYLKDARRRILILVFIVFVISAIAADILGKRIVRPLNYMNRKIRMLSGRHVLFQMEDTYRTGDEIEELAESFAKLSKKTVNYVEKVKEITAEKERISTELAMANAIQTSQLPQIFPPFPDRKEFDLFASMRPAKEVGGDFYDFFLVDHDHVGLVMADVSGKGVPAALFMMIAKTLIKNRVSNGESLASAMANVNEQLQEGNEAGMFVTVWLCVLELSTGKGVVVNAGHEHPALRRAGGTYELVKYKHSPAMGTMDGLTFTEREFRLQPGDSFFVYTDGVAEATSLDDELFGTQRMLDALNKDPGAPPKQILRNVMKSIREFVGKAEQFDDITMLCLKYVGPEA